MGSRIGSPSVVCGKDAKPAWPVEDEPDSA